MTDPTEAAVAPVLRVVRGAPDDIELAALLAVLAARSGGDDSAPAAADQGGWADRSQFVRGHLPYGRGAWRQSARTR